MELQINRTEKRISILTYYLEIDDIVSELDYLFPDSSWVRYTIDMGPSFKYPSHVSPANTTFINNANLTSGTTYLSGVNGVDVSY